MKRIRGLLALLLAALLLAFSESALDAAREALSVWWSSVLPSLFPFFVCISLLQAAGVSKALAKSGRFSGAVCFLIGGISGYPAGARFSAMLGQERIAPYTNLCSPAFLLGAISVGMVKDARLFPPLAIAHYGAALIVWVLEALLSPKKCGSVPVRATMQPADATLLGCIADGMLSTGKIGGCIVFFFVLSAMLQRIGLLSLIARPFTLFGAREDALYAVLTGILEFSTGASAVARLGLPPRVAASCLAAVVSFGGLCVFLQARMFLPEGKPRRYLVCKAVEAVVAAGIAYHVYPLFFPGEAPAAALSAEELAENGLSVLSLAASSAIGLAFIGILAAAAARIERRKARKKAARLHADGL